MNCKRKEKKCHPEPNWNEDEEGFVFWTVLFVNLIKLIWQLGFNGGHSIKCEKKTQIMFATWCCDQKSAFIYPFRFSDFNGI